MTGLEPITNRLTADCSTIELHHHGTPERTRTFNPQIRNLMLFHLSYKCIKVAEEVGFEPTQPCQELNDFQDRVNTSYGLIPPIYFFQF